uniref:Uncharacterized protein n=1 Tax=viral metagenome TaxID=1070528 RepID=A0A6H1ZH83_9ZZZZ
MALLTEVIDNFGGGIHHGSPTIDLPENTSIQLKNIAIKNRTYISNRKGFTRFSRSRIRVGGIEQPISGLFEYNYEGTKTLLVTAGTKLYTYNTTTHTYTDSGITITTGYKQHFLKHYENIIMYNGVDTPVYYDGTSFTELSNAPTGNFMESYTGTIFASTNDNYMKVQFSKDYGSFTEWPGTYNQLVSESKFDRMRAFKKVNDFIGGLAFSDEEAYTLSGSNLNDYVFLPLFRGNGCLNQEVLQIEDGIPIWLNRKGFHTLDSRKPIRFNQLDNVFTDVQMGQFDNAWAVKYWGGLNSFPQYLCALTLGNGQTVNNYIFKYDYVSGGWTYDTGMPCKILANGKDSDDNEILYGVNNDGWIYQLYDGESDYEKAISSSYISYPVTFRQELGKAAPYKEKQLQEIEIWYRSKYDGQFDVMVVGDFDGNEFPGSGVMQSCTIEGEGDPPSHYYFDAMESTSHFLRNKVAKHFSISPGNISGRSFGIRIDCNDPAQDWEILKIIIKASEK